MSLKHLFFISICVVVFAACKTESAADKIAKLEQAIATKPSAESIAQLMDMYQLDLQNAGKDATAKALTIGKMAQLQLKNNQAKEAINLLKTGIRDYYSAPATANNIWALGDIFKKNLQNADVGKTIDKIYAEKFPNGANIAAAKQGIVNDTTTLSEYLDVLGSKMYNDQTHRLDTKIAGNFIESCELYALLKPEDSRSPDYLHKAGETARAIRAFSQAIDIYDRLYLTYPNFNKAPQALFLKAFTYDNDLKQFDKARALYTEFLNKYPNDDFADDTQFLLSNLGKSDEQIIQSFNKKEQ